MCLPQPVQRSSRGLAPSTCVFSAARALLQSPSFFVRERDRDAANANLRMWMALGFSLQFALGGAGLEEHKRVLDVLDHVTAPAAAQSSR